MTYGVSTTNLANVLLNTIRGIAFAAPATWAQLHTGDPGAAGTANLSSNTTRVQLTFAASSGGSIALASLPIPWNMSTTETITGISIWSAATGGNVYWDVPLAAPQTVNSGDTLTLQTCTMAVGPLSV